jgi:hypothetical protein
MFQWIGTDNFDVDVSCGAPCGNLFPFSAGHFNRVAGVGDDVEPELKIVCSQPVRQAVTFAFDAHAAQVPESLLDRVDAQVHGTYLLRQSPRKGRFSCSWQPCENEQR